MLNLDLDGMFKGNLPWSAKEWREVYQWYHKLQETPKDDWSLDEMGLTEGQLKAALPESLHLMQELIDKGLLKEPRAGGNLAVRCNVFHPWHQLACFLMNRYPVNVWFYHFHRFMTIGEFLLDHGDGLKRDGLIRDSGQEWEEIRQETIEVLCLLPFTKTYYINGEERHTLDYDEVVAESRRLIAEAEDDAGHDGE